MLATTVGRMLWEAEVTCDQDKSQRVVHQSNILYNYNLISVASASIQIEFLFWRRGSACTLMRKCTKRKWIHKINKKREHLGEYYKLCQELECFEDSFFIYFRMSRVYFVPLLWWFLYPGSYKYSEHSGQQTRTSPLHFPPVHCTCVMGMIQYCVLQSSVLPAGCRIAGCCGSPHSLCPDI